MRSCRPTSFYVYGHPNEEAQDALEDLQPIYFNRRRV